MQAVDVEAADLEPVFAGAGFVPAPHRLQEMRELDVAPHPVRKSCEGAALAPDAKLAHEPVDLRGVRPLRFERKNAEAVALR
jgi:hypothetical protein